MGADSAQTLTILTKLAHLHEEIEDFKAAAAVHRRYVKVAEQEGRNTGEMATSYLFLAQYELDLLHRDANNYQDEDEDEEEMGEGKEKFLGCGRTTEGESSSEPDIETAVAWLEKVIESGAPEREIAEEDLRYIRRKQGRRRVTFSPEV